MKRKIFTFSAFLLLTVAVLAQQTQNPPSVWCDYHGASFIKGGVEFPNGVCYDVYMHSYYDNNCRCTRTHKMVMKCPK